MSEIGADGVDVRTLRSKLQLDSGYLSRLLQSLTTQGLVAVTKGAGDGRRRRVSLTRKGSAERAAYDRLLDKLAALGAHNLDYVVEDGEMSATTSRLRERQFKEIVS